MSYVHDRSNAREGRLVRLYMRFFSNGALIDPDSFGEIVVTPENDQGVRLAQFSGPVRYEIGTYYVEWRVPSSDPSEPWYSTLFAEIVGQGERNFRDTWNNVRIGGESFSTQGNFYARGDDEALSFDASNLLAFSFALKSNQIPKGSQDYLVVRCAEVDNKIIPGGSGWPDGEIAVRRDRRMISNFAQALHRGTSNEYALFVDTSGMAVGTYETQLRFRIAADSVESPAQTTGTRSLASGYAPPAGSPQLLALDVDGQRADVFFESDATRGRIAGAGVHWASEARLESDVALLDGINNMDGITATLRVDSCLFAVAFADPAHSGLLVSQIVQQINTAARIAIGRDVAETFFDGTNLKIRLFSRTRATHTADDLTLTSRVEVVSVAPPLRVADFHNGTGLNPSTLHSGTDFAQPISPGDSNSHLRVMVDPTGAGSTYQDVDLPFGLWSPSDIVDFLNGDGQFSRAAVIASVPSADPTAESYALAQPAQAANLEITIEANDLSGGISAASCTFADSGSGTGLLSLNQVVAQLAAALGATLDATVDVVAFGSASYLRVRSNVSGASSSVLVASGTALTVLGLSALQGSSGGDPIAGASAVLLGDGRLQIVGGTPGYASTVTVDASANGSTANEMLGLPAGGAIAHGTNAAAAAEIGAGGPAEPFGAALVASTRAALDSGVEPSGGWPVGGLSALIDVDGTRFRVDFEEKTTTAEVVGSVSVVAVSFQADHKIYYTFPFGTNAPLAGRRYAGPGVVQIDGDGSPGSCFAMARGWTDPLGVRPLNSHRIHPCYLELMPATISGTFNPTGGITGNDSGATATLLALFASPSVRSGRWIASGQNPGVAQGFTEGSLVGVTNVITAAAGGTATVAALGVDDSCNWFHAALRVVGAAARPWLPGHVVTNGSGVTAIVVYDEAAAGSNWLVLREPVGGAFAAGDTISNMMIVDSGVASDVRNAGSEVVFSSVDGTDNHLLVSVNGGAERDVDFDVASNPWQIGSVVSRINSVLVSHADQGQADAFGGYLAVRSLVAGVAGSVRIAGAPFGSGADVPLGIQTSPVTASIKATADSLRLVRLQLTGAADLGEAALATRSVGSVITGSVSGASGTIVDVMYYDSATIPGPLRPYYMVLFELIGGTEFAAGDEVRIGANPIGDFAEAWTRVDPLVPASWPTTGEAVDEALWWDAAAPIPRPTTYAAGFAASFDSSTGDLGVTPFSDKAWSESPGAAYLFSASRKWYASDGASRWTATSQGAVLPLTSLDVADQINAAAYSGGLPDAPATVVAGPRVRLSGSEYGSAGRVAMMYVVPDAYEELGFWTGATHLFAEPGFTTLIETWALGAGTAYPSGKWPTSQADVSSIGPSGSLYAFALSAIAGVAPDPWPLDQNLLEGPPGAPGSVAAQHWGYGSCGSDGNDLFRVEVNGTAYEARLPTATSGYAALAASITAAIPGVSASRTGSAQLQVATVATGAAARLRVLGGSPSEGSTAAEAFGWGGQRLRLADASGALTAQDSVLYDPADPAWFAYVSAAESPFQLDLGMAPYAPPGGAVLRDFLSGGAINCAAGTPMLDPTRWHRASVGGATAVTSNVTFTAADDQISIVASSRANYADPNLGVCRARFAASGTSTYAPADIPLHLNKPRVGVTTAHATPWPGLWAGGMLVVQPAHGAAAILDAPEGAGTLRLDEIPGVPGSTAAIRRILLSGIPAGVTFNLGDRVQWTHAAVVRYGWVTWFKKNPGPAPSTGEMVVVADPATNPTVLPAAGDGAIRRVSVPATTAVIGATVTDAGVRFVLGLEVEGWQLNGIGEYKIGVFTVAGGTDEDCHFVPGSFRASLPAGVLLLEDMAHTGAAPVTGDSAAIGAIRVIDTSETTAWYLLGLDAEAAGRGLYDRVGGGHCDPYQYPSPGWGPEARGTNATPPRITGTKALAQSWIVSTSNCDLQLRFDGDMGGWVSCRLDSRRTLGVSGGTGRPWAAGTVISTSSPSGAKGSVVSDDGAYWVEADVVGNQFAAGDDVDSVTPRTGAVNEVRQDPSYQSVWDVLDLLNGRGVVAGIGAEYPFTCQAGRTTLCMTIDETTVVTVTFNAGDSYGSGDAAALINARFVAAGLSAAAYDWDGQVIVVSGRRGLGGGITPRSAVRIHGPADPAGPSTINGFLGFPPQGAISTARGEPMLVMGATLKAIAYPSGWPAEGGQVLISSLVPQSDAQDSAVEANSVTGGGTANPAVGFSYEGVGPAFGNAGSAVYDLAGDGGIVAMINAAFGGLAVADAAGNSLRLTSTRTGPDACVRVLPDTTWDVQSKFGLTPQLVQGTALVTAEQVVASPWLQFDVT